MEHLLTTESILAFLTLTIMEVVLGIDNVVFIAIITGKLPEKQQAKARTIGLAGAMVMRIGLLFAISWIIRMTAPVFSLLEHPFSGRDLVMLGGGLFLIYKATDEIHEKLEGHRDEARKGKAVTTFGSAIAQIMVLDAIFSIDSVITAVGMAKHIEIMVAAVVIAVVAMMIFAGPVSDFIARHPTTKMLALSFLLLIGVMLVAEGFGKHIEKGYIYFAMGFSIFVEMLNLRFKSSGKGLKTGPVVPQA